MNTVHRIEFRLKQASSKLCIVSGWLLILLSLAVCFEVLVRKIFNYSLQGVDEYGGYILAISSALGFVYAFYANSHIKIDLLVRRLPKKAQLILSLFSNACLMFVVLLFAYQTLLLAYESWEFMAISNTPLRTPIYIPQLIWSLAWFSFAIAIAFRITNMLIYIRVNDWGKLQELQKSYDPEEEQSQALRPVNAEGGLVSVQEGQS
ncbi:TRAP transporter small permease subunit [Photobacterium satsumensis]|uniref:TRAP transporter small permease subunit n=1 Tax=Photobacterium satsumensis TaxID=2910239 RepID=UPI003D12966A